MPKPQSRDLREKLFEQVDSVISITKARKIFRVNRQKYIPGSGLRKKQVKQKAKSGYQKGRSHKIKDLGQLKKFIQEILKH